MIRVGFVIVIIAVLAAVVGPTLSPYDPASQELSRRLERPSLAHPFGLDELGRLIGTLHRSDLVIADLPGQGSQLMKRRRE